VEVVDSISLRRVSLMPPSGEKIASFSAIAGDTWKTHNDKITTKTTSFILAPAVSMTGF
jgi:hypothetical protein